MPCILVDMLEEIYRFGLRAYILNMEWRVQAKRRC